MKFSVSVLATASFFAVAITNLPNQCQAYATKEETSSIRSYDTARRSLGTKAIKATKASKGGKSMPKEPELTAMDPNPEKAASAQRVVTMWYVIFNKPSNCNANPSGGDIKCGISDIYNATVADNGNDAKISIMHAAGGISDENGYISLAATLYKSKRVRADLGPIDTMQGHESYAWGGPEALYANMDGEFRGYYGSCGEEPEVHITFRDHGPPMDTCEDRAKQLTRFLDPMCSEFDGPHVCESIASVEFPALVNELQMMTKDIGRSALYPEGCLNNNATDSLLPDTCTKVQNDLQLSTGMGNHVTLFKRDEYVQVMAELQLPMVSFYAQDN